MAMSAKRQQTSGWWARNGAIQHRFRPATSARRCRTCLVCGGGKYDEGRHFRPSKRFKPIA